MDSKVWPETRVTIRRTQIVQVVSRTHKLLHVWIILVIVTQRLVQIGRIDGPAEYLS